MRKIQYIFLAGLLALTACHVIDTDGFSDIPEVATKDMKVPIEFNISIPNDGASTRAMADEPQVKNIVVAVFGGSGYFNEWVPAEAEPLTEYATENETLYKLKVKLSMSESRLRLHIIANCPSEFLEHPPITGNSGNDTEDIIMDKVRSKLGDTYKGSNIEDGYWQKVYIPYGIAAEIDPNGNGDNPYLIQNNELVPTVLTLNQFKMISPIPLVRNFARIQLVNNAEGVEISHVGLAYAPAEGVIAPMISTPFKVDEWGARLSVTETPGHEDEQGGWHDGTATYYPVEADKVYSYPGLIENEHDSRIPGLHVFGHELKNTDGSDKVLAATTGSVYDEVFLTNYQNLPMTQPSGHADWRLLTEAPYNYGGYSPYPITFAPNPTSKANGDPDKGFQDYKPNGYIYVYERTKPRTYSNHTEKATRIIIRARKGGDSGVWKYYPLDIVDDKGNNIALLRNFTYVVTLTGISPNSGEVSAEDALDATGANVSGDPRTQDLNEVSDGVSSIVVSYIDTTAIASGTYSVMYKFIPDAEHNGSQSNKDVSIEVGYDGTTDGFQPGTQSLNGATFAGTLANPSVWIEMEGTAPKLYYQDGNSWKVAATDAQKAQAWSKIIYTTVGTEGNTFTYNSFGTIRVTGTRANGKIYRDVRVNIIKKKMMQVECADKYVQRIAGSHEDLVIRIPDDLTRSMFPLQFKIEGAASTVTPRDGDNLPVQSGKSTVPGMGSRSSFFFVKTLTKQEYDAIPSVNGWKEFTCKFKTTKAASATTLYVTNEYFEQGSDNFMNYDQRLFTEAKFSRQAAIGEEVNFRFTMDAAHTGAVVWDTGNITEDSKVIPRKVTIKLNGLVPRADETGHYLDDGLVHKQGAPEGYYIYNVPSTATQTPVLHLMANEEKYSVELSTVDLDVPESQPDFVPNPDLYKPLIVEQNGGGSGYYSISNVGSYGWTPSNVNPDSDQYYAYQSNNQYVNGSIATMKVTVVGYTEFTVYIRSNAESRYDYVVVRNIGDAALTSWSNAYDGAKANTRNNQQSGTAVSNYTAVTFTTEDGLTDDDTPHTFYIQYGKDSNTSEGSDRGYVLIPKEYDRLPVESVAFNLTNANTVTSNNVTISYSNCEWDWDYYAVRLGNNNGAVNISVPKGYKLVSVSLTFTHNPKDLAPSTGTFSRNGSSAEWVPTEDTNTVTLTNTSNGYRPRINTILVEYISSN